jgi:hypothetical protein
VRRSSRVNECAGGACLAAPQAPIHNHAGDSKCKCDKYGTQPHLKVRASHLSMKEFTVGVLVFSLLRMVRAPWLWQTLPGRREVCSCTHCCLPVPSRYMHRPDCLCVTWKPASRWHVPSYMLALLQPGSRRLDSLWVYQDINRRNQNQRCTDHIGRYALIHCLGTYITTTAWQVFHLVDKTFN